MRHLGHGMPLESGLVVAEVENEGALTPVRRTRRRPLCDEGEKMTRSTVALALALALAACSPSSDSPPTPPVDGKSMGAATIADFRTDTHMLDLMNHVIDYNAWGVWNAQGWIIDKDGIHELFPTDEAGWHAAESAAFTLAESANALLLPGRPRSGDRDWVEFSNMLYDAAKKAQETALTRDKQAFFDAGGEIYQACTSCHNRYLPNAGPIRRTQLPELPNRTPPPNQ
jgi:hypothetical protein